jgi:hypothetical protein
MGPLEGGPNIKFVGPEGAYKIYPYIIITISITIIIIVFVNFVFLYFCKNYVILL